MIQIDNVTLVTNKKIPRQPKLKIGEFLINRNSLSAGMDVCPVVITFYISIYKMMDSGISIGCPFCLMVRDLCESL